MPLYSPFLTPMKYYTFIAGAAILLTACNRQELADSNRERDSLLTVLTQREAVLTEFISSFNEVESNLDSVAARQHLIRQHAGETGELKSDQKTRINDEIAAINNLMDENRKRIAGLEKKIKGADRQNAQLMKTIAMLKDQIVQKDMELTELNAQLASIHVQVEQLETSVNALTEENEIQSQKIADETRALHTAYYRIGKSSELQDAKIIDRKGGLLGIGRTSSLRGDFDNSKFTRIDYTETGTIAVNSDMKIITSHPSDSYKLDKDDQKKNSIRNIVITNPEKFWSASKYLVVVKI